MENRLTTLARQMEQELRQDILPFWLKYPADREKGGFYGAITNDLQINDEVERSLVLCARVLWTFSAAYRLYRDPAYLEMAQHAYAYLTGPFLDRQHGGMYWWIDRYGRPVNDRKQTYGQAFAIYGLSEFYRVTGETAALEQAKAIFDLIERHAFEPIYGGYVEGCAADWSALADMRLSPKEPNSPKSMNTLLHVLEGYTNLLRAWPDPRLKAQQTRLLQVFLDHVVDPQTHFTRLFFENDWRSLADLISYGHDIETSWLLVEAAEVVGDPALIERTRKVAVEMAEAVYNQGLDTDGAVMAEGSPRGIHHPEKHWWCEAEGIVGFVNAYLISGDEKYATAALRIWDFIEDKMVDRQHGEWFKVLTRAGLPMPGQVKAGPWEDPYHHSRACMEIIHRIGCKKMSG
jgi:cellobiose epimerase